MLTITVGAFPYDMFPGEERSFGTQDASPSLSPTDIYEYTSGGYQIHLTGSFIYTVTTSGNTTTTALTGGTLTSVTVYDPSFGENVVSLTNFNASVATLQSIATAGDVNGLEAALLNGSGLIVYGSDYNDRLDGTAYDDIFQGGGGDDVINGEGGTGNIAVYSGPRSGYEFTATTAGLSVQSNLGTDTLTNIQLLQFSDGTVVAGAVVHKSAINAARFQNIAASSLFSSVDALGLAPVRYQFMDMTAATDSGYLTVNGVAQANGATVTTTSLSSVGFHSRSGVDHIQVRIFDGYAWSAWSTSTVTAPLNHGTTITPAAQPGVPLLPGATIVVSSLFSTTDLEGDAVVKFQVRDDTVGGGTLRINGVNQVNNQATVLPGDLGSVTFTTGTGTDVIEVRGYDGLDWGTWQTLSITGSHVAPTVTALSSTVTADRLQAFGFADLFTAGQVQGDSLLKYDFLDGTTGNGAIVLDGVAQAAGVDVIVTADQLADLSFVAAGTDTLSVRVYDGHNWSARAKVSITSLTDQAPTALFTSPAVQPRAGAVLQLSDLVSATDPENDTITEYRIYDSTPGGGTLRRNGINEGTSAVYVAASDLGSLTYTVGTSDTLNIRAFDGATWSAWETVTIAGKNLAPAVTAATSTVSASHLQSFGFSDLFTSSDPQGSNIVKYDFYDGTVGGGAIELNGTIQAAQTDIVVNASALSSLSFVASGTDVLYARVWDGYSWSARTKVTVTAPTDAAPRVSTTTTVYAAQGTSTAVSSLFSATDTDDAQMTLYEFRDATPGRGTLLVNGVSRGNAATIVQASDLDSVTFISGSNDVLYVKAFDGLTWSGWTTITIKATPPGLFTFDGATTIFRQAPTPIMPITVLSLAASSANIPMAGGTVTGPTIYPSQHALFASAS